jgi:hypothetical protein
MQENKLAEIAQMISIRDYVSGAINNFSLDKKVVSEYNTMLILLDRRIQRELLGDEFKNFVGFEEREKAIREVAAITNIKSGMVKK